MARLSELCWGCDWAVSRRPRLAQFLPDATSFKESPESPVASANGAGEEGLKAIEAYRNQVGGQRERLEAAMAKRRLGISSCRG